MAKRVYKKRAYKKRAPRRGAKPGGKSGKSLNFPGTLIPQHVTAKLVYMTTLQKSCPASGAIGALNIFRLNSIWDPDQTTALTGTTALGVYQYQALYQRYRVYRCDYTITLTNLSEDTVVTGAIVPTNYNDTSYSVSDYMRPMAKKFLLGNRSGQNRTVVKGSIYLPKLAGVSAVQYKTDTNNQSGILANPVSVNNLTIVANSSNAGITPSVAFQVQLIYHTEFMSTQASVEGIDHATGLPIVPTSGGIS